MATLNGLAGIGFWTNDELLPGAIADMPTEAPKII